MIETAFEAKLRKKEEVTAELPEPRKACKKEYKSGRRVNLVEIVKAIKGLSSC